MKWVTLLKDIKEKVGLTHSPSSSSPATTVPPPSSPAYSHNASSSSTFQDFSASPSRFFSLPFLKNILYLSYMFIAYLFV